jgi:serine/threonine protein kinase
MTQRATGVADALLDVVVRHAGTEGLAAPDLKRLVERDSHGATVIPEGGLTVTLHRLRDKGLIKAVPPVVPGRRRVLYIATDEGRIQRRQAAELRTGEWHPGSSIQGRRDSYELLRELRYPSPALMFVANRSTSTGVARRRKDGPFPSSVIIKCAWCDLQNVTAAAVRRYATAVTNAIRLEIPTLEELNALDSVAKTFDWGERYVTLGNDEELRLPFLVQEKLEGTPLFMYVSRQYPGGVPSADQWLTMAEQLCRALLTVHERATVFRNISPSTIMMCEGEKPVFADLGEALFASPVPSRTPDDHARAYTAPERRGVCPKPSRRADIYSLGAVLFYLALGRAPDFDDCSDDETLKTRVLSALAVGPHRLATHNFGIADIISRCLRPDPETRVQTANALLSDIHLFRGSAALTLQESVSRVLPLVKAIRRGDVVFQSLAAVDLLNVESRMQQLLEGRLTITGGHDEIVSQLSSYLSTLGAGCRYDTVSTVRFWSRENLGVRGRFLSMNLEAARKGAHLRRIFLLSEEDRRSAASVEVITAQLDMQRTFSALPPQYTGSGRIESWFRIMDADEIEVRIRAHDHMGAWIRGSSVITLKPVYNSNGIITSVRIERLEQPERVRQWFDGYLLGAIKLTDSWASHPKWPRPLTRGAL